MFSSSSSFFNQITLKEPSTQSKITVEQCFMNSRVTSNILCIQLGHLMFCKSLWSHDWQVKCIIFICYKKFWSDSITLSSYTKCLNHSICIQNCTKALFWANGTTGGDRNLWKWGPVRGNRSLGVCLGGTWGPSLSLFLSFYCHKVSHTAPLYAICHGTLPHCGTRSNAVKWPWTNSSETVQQSSSIVFLTATKMLSPVSTRFTFQNCISFF